jgi:hypothetical protein
MNEPYPRLTIGAVLQGIGAALIGFALFVAVTVTG